MQIVCLPAKTREFGGSKATLFRPDNGVEYVQPPRPAIKVIREPYKPRSTRIETDTTYTASYFNPESTIKAKKICSYPRNPWKVYGKFDMNTSNKVSYKWPKIERPKTCYPQTRLGCGTSPMETVTVHSSSYIDPGVVNTKSAKHPYIRRPVTAPMESTTIVRESYQHPGRTYKRPSIVNSPNDRRKWRLSVKPDYETIQRSSYQTSIVDRRTTTFRPVYKKAHITAKINCETTYNTSYMIPGYFRRKKN